MALKKDWIDGEVLYADDLNDNFNELLDLLEFGDGSDGALNVSSGTTNLDGERVYDFTSVTISSGATLSTNDQNKPIIIRSQGDVTIEGTIDLDGKGGRGGMKEADEPYVEAEGGWGTGSKRCYGLKSNENAASDSQAPGGGGGGMKEAGTDGENNTDSGGESFPISVNYLNKSQIVLGSGGGPGNGGRWNAINRSGGAGGNGGGGILIIALGKITISGTITCKGLNGQVGSAGGGGGGSGGCVILYSKEGITNTGTIDVSGGAGSNGNSRDGGAGSDGYSCLLTKTDWANGVY